LPEAIMVPRKIAEPTPLPPSKADKAAVKMPAAGPHARPELTNFDACPGAGALPSEKELFARESDPGAG
jgi:hypothetical protein